VPRAQRASPDAKPLKPRWQKPIHRYAYSTLCKDKSDATYEMLRVFCEGPGSHIDWLKLLTEAGLRQEALLQNHDQ
jgi:hypothetical protein